MNARSLAGSKKQKKKINLNSFDDSNEQINSLEFMYQSIVKLEKKLEIIEKNVKKIKSIVAKQDQAIRDKVQEIRKEFDEQNPY